MDAPVSDITIPAADAKRIAQALRHESKGGHRDHIGCPSCEAMWRAADLLDPPPAPSLRDEVAVAMSESWAERDGWEAAADAVLAVVRRHVEGLNRVAIDRDGSLAYVPDGDMVYRDDVLLMVYRDDVLLLLGGEE